MQTWLGRKLIGYVMGRTRQGDIRPTLLLDHSDVRLTFPGRNSWSGTFTGKPESSAGSIASPPLACRPFLTR